MQRAYGRRKKKSWSSPHINAIDVEIVDGFLKDRIMHNLWHFSVIVRRRRGLKIIGNVVVLILK